MSWNPEGEPGTLIQKVLTPAREDALQEFDDGRKRIEHEQAHRGVMGGPVVRRCVDLAGATIDQFATGCSCGGRSRA